MSAYSRDVRRNALWDAALDEVRSYIHDHEDPADVFDEEDLARWARDNGWVRPEEG